MPAEHGHNSVYCIVPDLDCCTKDYNNFRRRASASRRVSVSVYSSVCAEVAATVTEHERTVLASKDHFLLLYCIGLAD